MQRTGKEKARNMWKRQGKGKEKARKIKKH